MDRPDLVVESLRGNRLLVVGDLILDRYIRGDAGRMSPEAPVPIIHVRSEDVGLGGAANVAANAASLGGKPLLVGAVGRDEAGQLLRRQLEEHKVSVKGVRSVIGRPTIEKTRVIARQQQVVRFDREELAAIPAEVETRLCELIAQQVNVRAVVLSDYGKGLLTPRIIQAACQLSAEVLVDPKGMDYRRYRGADLVTPNAAEAQAATGIDSSTLEGCRAAANQLLQEGQFQTVVITRGPQGIYFRTRNEEEGTAPARARGVFDVTGAGDTVIAVLALARAAGLSMEESLLLANAAAGLVVERLGAVAISASDLSSSLTGSASSAAKVMSREAAGKLARHARQQGRRVVLTNGCFDLLHAGHVQSLEFARSQGDFLAVAVNDDESVRRQKGEARPVLSVDQRMRVLAALACVDLVFAFGENTPEEVVRELTPNVLVKGEDWQSRGVVGQEWVESNGGQVVLAPLFGQHSTSGIIASIRQGNPRHLERGAPGDD